MYSRTRHPFLRCSTSDCVNYTSHLDLHFLKPHKLYIFFFYSNKDRGILFHHPTLAARQTPFSVLLEWLNQCWEWNGKATRAQGFPLTISMQTPPRQVSYIFCVSDRIPSFSCLCATTAFPTLPLRSPGILFIYLQQLIIMTSGYKPPETGSWWGFPWASQPGSEGKQCYFHRHNGVLSRMCYVRNTHFQHTNTLYQVTGSSQNVLASLIMLNTSKRPAKFQWAEISYCTE